MIETSFDRPGKPAGSASGGPSPRARPARRSRRPQRAEKERRQSVHDGTPRHPTSQAAGVPVPRPGPAPTPGRAEGKPHMLAPKGTTMNADKPGGTSTWWNLVARAAGEPGEASRAAFGELFERHTPMLRKFARSFEPNAARREDLIQGFYTRTLARGDLASACEEGGSFRSFLRTAFRRYAIDVHRRERLRAVPPGSVDLDAFENEDPAQDRYFDQCFAQATIDRVLAGLAAFEASKGRGPLFAALRDRLEYGDDDVKVRAIAASLGMSACAVSTHLHRLRAVYRSRLREDLAGMCARPEDVDAELMALRAAWRDQL